jgi:hypothetical protein
MTDVTSTLVLPADPEETTTSPAHLAVADPATPVVVVAASALKYSKAWWADTADRVISTVAQTAISTIAVPALVPDLRVIDWVGVASISAAAGLLSFLKALALSRAKTA